MANPFDQFDARAAKSAGGNLFDQFDEPQKQSRSDERSVLSNMAAGMASGVADIGDTILNAATYLPGKVIPGVKQWNDERSSSLQDFNNERKDSTAFNLSRIAGNIAGTYPVGGVLASGVRAVAPGATGLSNAIATGGMRAGAVPAGANWLTRAGNIGLRTAGGATTGGAAAALINPEEALTGAAVGGVLPPALSAAGHASGYAGRAVGSLVEPFTPAGQDRIAGRVVRRFAEGGPTAVNAAEIVPGSMPTLAEATGNAGLATLQRGTRDVRPNAFVEREATNVAARNAAFEQAAGDAGQLEFYRASRATAADELYRKAMEADTLANLTPYVKGQITQLLKRPSVDQASKTAQRWAIERGEKPSAAGSLPALHDVKMAIDDKIAEAVQRGAGGEVKALQATKDKLLGVMERLSPDYAEARHTYAQMSAPVNAMESLQGLRLTDAQGNITLAKVQNALRSVEGKRQAPGARPEKSITDDQIGTLRAIRDDLMRQSNLGLGRSIGSNTFQNLATDNILNSTLGNALTRMADKFGVSGAVGQVGQLAYNRPNEAIRNRLADMMLQPQLAEPALTGLSLNGPPNRLLQALTSPFVQQPLYRSAPALSSSQ